MLTQIVIIYPRGLRPIFYHEAAACFDRDRIFSRLLVHTIRLVETAYDFILDVLGDSREGKQFCHGSGFSKFPSEFLCALKMFRARRTWNHMRNRKVFFIC